MTKAERRELQEKQKAEKAARVSAGLPASGKKAAQVLNQPNSGFSPNPSKSLATSFPGAEAEKAIAAAESTGQARRREKLTKEIGLFAHLDPPKFANTALAPKDLHPAVVHAGLQMAQFKICGANARCVATLNAFRKVCCTIFVHVAGLSSSQLSMMLTTIFFLRFVRLFKITRPLPTRPFLATFRPI